jgi:hypothetical protein
MVIEPIFELRKGEGCTGYGVGAGETGGGEGDKGKGEGKDDDAVELLFCGASLL